MGPEAEFQEFDHNGSWGFIYQQIRTEASLNHDYSLQDSRRPEFRHRNRYRDVSPYDHSRIVLRRDNINYINANLVEAPEAHRSYILTQGPLPGTSGHFWLMVWEQNSKAVLMLNRTVERGRIKCHQYFPMGEVHGDQDDMFFEDVDLKVTYMGEKDLNYFLIRTLQIEDLRTGDTKEVLQFHYTTWPDFGVPQSPSAFLGFLMAVRECGALETTVGPPVIHCSAGIGRSGTFCLVDTCLVLIEKNGDPNCVSVIDILMEMRRYRMGLIQTPDQLRFSYLAIIEGAHWVLSSTEGLDDELCEPHVKPEYLRQMAAPEDDDEIPPPFPPRNKPPAPPDETRAPIIHPVNSTSNLEPLSVEPVETYCDENGDLVDLEQKRKEGVAIRRRHREERLKNTAEQLQRMREKQRKSENRKPYQSMLRPALIGLSVTLLIGGYFLYTHYTH